MLSFMVGKRGMTWRNVARCGLALTSSALTLACGGESHVLPAASAQPVLPAVVQATLSLGEPLGELPRIGVNLGGRTAWGAEQLMRNVLRNPGLEAGQDGALIVVGQVDATGIEDDTPWTARAPGFWAGARFEVLSGSAAGQQGRVLDNQRTGPGGPDRLALQPLPAGLRRGDVLALQGGLDATAAPLWWTQGAVLASTDTRPGSPGQRSIRLLGSPSQPASLLHHLDSIGARAGKLLPVRGPWRLTLWARASGAGARLQLRFARSGQAPWVNRSVVLGPAWQAIDLAFDARNDDDGPVGPLMLSLVADQGAVWVDDISLGPQGDTPGGFRAELVQTLQALRPGYLRDWQGQLADTPANRQADPLARRPTRYRPGEHEWHFAYSLPEFLALAAAVGARPWVVLPATSTPQEALAFGQALRRGWLRHRFDEIVVEHGNEHWNAVFRPAGVADTATLATVADRAFVALREGAGAEPVLHRVLGAQYVNPAAAERLARLSVHSEGVAVAPYFHYRQDATDSTEAALDRALSEHVEPLRQAVAGVTALAKAEALNQAKPLAVAKAVDVYEVNFHTTSGTASAAQRNAVLEHPAAGAALMRRLLQAATLGVRRQAVYAITGFDTYTDQRELVGLFGITRDLAQASQWRPTGEAMRALNAVAGGPAHAAQCRGTGCAAITAVAFGGGARWAIVNAASTALTVSWPCQPSAAPRACVQGRAQAELAPRSWITTGP